MRVGTRIFVWYVVIFLVCFSYPAVWLLDTLRFRYLESSEDSLADQANILAALVGAQMERKHFRTKELYRAFDDAYNRELSARIYSFTKTGVDMQVYITDASGMVIFNSADPSSVGDDYSRWRDVKLTLQGKYGTRATRDDPKDPTSTVLHVAAPIMVKNRIAGVMSVAKPTATINDLIAKAKPELIRVLGVATFFFVLFSFLVSIWTTRSIKRLTRYANEVREGRRTPLPKLDSSEIGQMGNAFERMREALEGKKYVEGYVQTLTHEIKSPLSAIRGAAELLEEKMEPAQRERFLSNIKTEANRIQDIVDRLLELSSIETIKTLEKHETVSFPALLGSVLDGKAPLIAKKSLRISLNIPPDASVRGDHFLLTQATANLIQNAIDFSPSGGQIDISGSFSQRNFVLCVRDFGPGIPDFAREKIFDKFFSLQRPDTEKKSTGLGLNFVREVAMLHKGNIELENCEHGGVRAVFTLPAK
jgi:two-component system sensor histidine kinase CreC